MHCGERFIKKKKTKEMVHHKNVLSLILLHCERAPFFLIFQWKHATSMEHLGKVLQEI